MAKDKKTDRVSIGKLEHELKAVEEQALLYAKDLSRMFKERKEKDRQLELTKQQLARSARIALLGELAAGIAHEISNILTPAVGITSILLVDRSNLSEKTIEGLEVIEKSLMKASGLLHQILGFSRKKPERREPANIGMILEQSLSLLGHRISKKQIKVEKNLAPDLPMVEVDDTQMEQVFTNLGLNAIDAMGPGDTLRVGTSCHYQNTPRKQPYVEISIEDTGCGIPSETLDHIFEPFYTTKETGRGTGLGLFICYGIVEKHGGTIDVESTPSVGTRFRICLPAG